MDNTFNIHSIEHARTRVTVGPMPEWAVIHPVDESWRAPGGAPYSSLLRDEQRHAEEHASFCRQVWRLETLQAVQDAAQWKFDFDPATQHLVIHSLTVRRGTMATEHAAIEKLRFLQREASLEAFVLDGWVSVLVLLEDVRVGDIIETVLTIKNHPRLFSERCFATVFPPLSHAARTWRWCVRFAGTRPMRWKGGPSIPPPTITENASGLTEWNWSLDNLRPETMEAGTPDWLLPSRWLQISDFTSWEEVASGVTASWQEDFDRPEIHQLVKEIVEHAPTMEKRATRAISTVQDDIRYLSVNLELGGTIPSPPGSVVQRRFGDCKDKSFLLAHLLRRVGVSARPVLVHTRLRSTLGTLLPTPLFDHVVIEYEIEGKRRWVDATIQLQGGSAHERFVPTYALGLPIGPGVKALEEQPVTRTVGQYTLHERFALDEVVRQSQVIVTMQASGGDADVLRNQLLMNGAERYGETRVDYYRNFFPGARMVGTVEWLDDRESNSFLCAFRLALPQTGPVSDDGRVNFFGYAAHAIRAGLPLVSAEKRSSPVRLPAGMRCHHIIELAGTQMASSAERMFSVRHGAFEFTGTSGNRPGGHVMHFSLNVRRDSLRPKEVTNYNARVQEVWAATELRLYVMPGQKFGVGRRKSDSLLKKPLAPPKTPDATPPAEPEPLPAAPVPALAPLEMAPSAARMGVAIADLPVPPILIPKPASQAPQPAAPRAAAGTAPAEPRERKPGHRTEPPEDEEDRSRGSRRRSRRRRRRQFLVRMLIVTIVIFFVVIFILWRTMGNPDA